MRRPLQIVGKENGLGGAANLSDEKLACLRELEKKALWLSAWMIHNANYLREDRDGIKVGGHQASCASASTLLTASCIQVTICPS